MVGSEHIQLENYTSKYHDYDEVAKLPSTFRYTFVPSGHPKDHDPEFQVGEPCMENPCSYEAVEKV